MENIIAIKHQVHFPIPDEEIRQAVVAHRGLNILNIVTIEPSRFSIGNAGMQDFPGLALMQSTAIRRELSRDLERGIGIAYFGLAPIPLCIHLGSLIGSRAKVIAFNLGHLSKSWVEDKEEPEVAVTGLPDRKILASGDVVMRISISFQVQSEETQAIIPDPLCVVDIAVPHPRRDVILSPKGSEKIANWFMTAVDEVIRNLPNAKRLHLFVKAPPGISFLLGTRIHDSWPLEVKLYHFGGSKGRFTETRIKIN